MKKMRKLGLLCVLLASMHLGASERKSDQPESSFLREISSKVLDTIHNSIEVPGINSQEFPALRERISQTWETLLKEGVLEVSGTDKDVRPAFVALQAVVEHVFASELQKSIKNAFGVIHTPMPATPLCSKGEVSKELVDPSIALDPARLFTVKARITTLRDYLFKGGQLCVLYSKAGYNQRTKEQREIYQQELKNYPEHLLDLPLNIESIPVALIGATYFLQDQKEDIFVFAIKITQAKDPQENGHFGLWFGPVDHPAIQKRLEALLPILPGITRGN